MEPITTPPIEAFLADVASGKVVVAQLRQLLIERKRLLIWGPRVGAIELAEDLLRLWPDEVPVMGINLGGPWTRTREAGQDSNWVSWVDTGPSQLVEQVLGREPAGVVLTYLSSLAQPVLPRLLSGPWGFVTALAATSSAQAIEQARALCGDAFLKFDVLVGVAQVGTATWISELDQLVAGAPLPLAHLAKGLYVADTAAT